MDRTTAAGRPGISVEDSLTETLTILRDTQNSIENTTTRMVGPRPSNKEPEAKEAVAPSIRDLLARVRSLAERLRVSANDLNESLN